MLAGRRLKIFAPLDAREDSLALLTVAGLVASVWWGLTNLPLRGLWLKSTWYPPTLRYFPNEYEHVSLPPALLGVQLHGLEPLPVAQSIHSLNLGGEVTQD